ncbi:TetR/AcrR family transcriptional regulator [Paenibacillus sp. P26]|nr:TetR/AcrR family transcriptional regulator [Paenibacillus sp. P26]
MDRRKRKTKLLLRHAMIAVMEEKGIDRITVSDLTDKADINRGTFYLHYTDAADMVRQVKEEIWDGLKQRLEKLNPVDYPKYAARNEPYPLVLQVVEYYGEHTDFFRVILGPKGRPSFAHRIKEFLKSMHISKVMDLQPATAHSIVPKEYMVTYLAAANLSLIQHWLESGKSQPASAIALMITHIVGGGGEQRHRQCLGDSSGLSRRL